MIWENGTDRTISEEPRIPVVRISGLESERRASSRSYVVCTISFISKFQSCRTERGDLHFDRISLIPEHFHFLVTWSFPQSHRIVTCYFILSGIVKRDDDWTDSWIEPVVAIGDSNRSEQVLIMNAGLRDGMTQDRFPPQVCKCAGGKLEHRTPDRLSRQRVER
jgi:hypothetical protein